MITLGFTGLLSLMMGVTLVVLMFIILGKEPDETTDNLDRWLLIGAFLCAGASLVMSGGLVMAGAAAGIVTAELSAEILINNSLKILFIIFSWIKILRNTGRKK